MASSTVSPTGISSTTQLRSTFATSITPSTVVSATSSTTPSESAANKPSKSSPWDNLNLLLIFVPLICILLILGGLYYWRAALPTLRRYPATWKKSYNNARNRLLAGWYPLRNAFAYRQFKARRMKLAENTGRVWANTTHGLETLATQIKTRLLQWFLRAGSSKMSTTETSETRAETPPAAEKHDYPPEDSLPDDPFPDTSTIASRSIHEQPGRSRSTPPV